MQIIDMNEGIPLSNENLSSSKVVRVVGTHRFDIGLEDGGSSKLCLPVVIVRFSNRHKFTGCAHFNLIFSQRDLILLSM